MKLAILILGAMLLPVSIYWYNRDQSDGPETFISDEDYNRAQISLRELSDSLYRKEAE